MVRRLALLVLASAPLVACGPHSRSRAEALATVGLVPGDASRAEESRDRDGTAGRETPLLLATTRDSAARPSRRDTTVGAELTVEADGGVRFALSVANPSKHRVELTFRDSRTRDFVVLDAGGREVWRWSAGRMFTQAMQARLVGAGDSVVYEGRWTPPVPGRYTVVAELRSENHPMERRVAFTVPAAPAGAQVAAH